jgi:hypothetical protein
MRATIWLASIAIVVSAVLLGYYIYRANQVQGMEPDSTPLFAILSGPLWLLQIFLVTAPLRWMTRVVDEERARRTWETLMISPQGARLFAWTRWMSVFYHLRWVIALVVAGRMLLAVEAVAAYVRDYDQYRAVLDGAHPAAGPILSAGLLAVFIPSAIVLPLVMMALNAAIGLATAAAVRSRIWIHLISIALIITELIVTCAAIILGMILEDCQLTTVCHHVPGGWRWLALLAMGTVGDQSMTFSNLRAFSDVWANTSHGVWLMLAIPVATLAQATLALSLVRWAGHKAGQPE